MAIMLMALMMGVPMIAILTNHQRKMAELIHGKHGENSDNLQLRETLELLTREVHHLRNQVYEQSIQLDTLRNTVSQSQTANAEVVERIREDA